MNLPTAPPLDQSLLFPTLPAEGNTATSATDFAQWLHAGADAASTLTEHAQGSLPAMALTPTEEPATDTDADTGDSEDLPWPPEGLASLWSPTLPPEPAPAPHSTVAAAPPPAASSDPPRTATATADCGVALTIHAPDTPEFPATTSAQPAPSPRSAAPDPLPASQAPAPPASTPTIPASPVPSASPISEDLTALVHRPEDLPGERASLTAPLNDAPLHLPLATPAIHAPAPFPLTQPQPTPPATTTPPLPAPNIHADDFTQALGPHIQWLVGHKIDHAHLHLNPQELGPLEVHLQLDGDQLQAHFNSRHVEVRQALEHALPQLRELLGEHGLNLSQSTVSQHSSQQQRPSPMPSAPGFAPDTADEDAPQPMPSAQPGTTHSLLDAYA